MCAVLFFPLGFNEATYKVEGGYFQKIGRESLSWIGLQTSPRKIRQSQAQQQTSKGGKYGTCVDIHRFWTIIRWIFPELGVTTPGRKPIY